jgi:hypothetical protein
MLLLAPSRSLRLDYPPAASRGVYRGAPLPNLSAANRRARLGRSGSEQQSSRHPRLLRGAGPIGYSGVQAGTLRLKVAPRYLATFGDGQSAPRRGDYRHRRLGWATTSYGFNAAASFSSSFGSASSLRRSRLPRTSSPHSPRNQHPAARWSVPAGRPMIPSGALAVWCGL